METIEVEDVTVDLKKAKKVYNLLSKLCDHNLEVILTLQYLKFMFERGEIINMTGQGHVVPQQDNDYIK